LKNLSRLQIGSKSANAHPLPGNPRFPEPTPTLADLNNSLKLFSDALALAKTGDRIKTVYKNQLRDNLDLTLTNLATYCSFIAQGDRFILASSGFSLNTEANASQTLGLPENFSVEIGQQSGSALVSLRRLTISNGFNPQRPHEISITWWMRGGRHCGDGGWN
jgi:hypothetical protein